jgi:5-methylcytosine-specific restriction enzyme subunit McrC
MYAYTKYFESDHTVLYYPGARDDFLNGWFFNEKQDDSTYPCSVFRISFDPADKITEWQEKITIRIDEHLTNKPQHQLQNL